MTPVMLGRTVVLVGLALAAAPALAAETAPAADQDFANAKVWYEKAAALGNAEAMQ